MNHRLDSDRGQLGASVGSTPELTRVRSPLAPIGNLCGQQRLANPIRTNLSGTLGLAGDRLNLAVIEFQKQRRMPGVVQLRTPARTWFHCGLGAHARVPNLPAFARFFNHKNVLPFFRRFTAEWFHPVLCDHEFPIQDHCAERCHRDGLRFVSWLW